MSFLEFFEHLHWDWPEWLNIEVLAEFLEDPLTMINDAIERVVEVLYSSLLDIDLMRLLDASKALLELNT
eukprot:6559172-Prymnesium_polylepis.2